MAKSCCFLGHSRVYEEIQPRLETIIEQLITKKGVTYINTPFSRAYPNIEQALKKKKTIFNLGTYTIE